MIQTFIIGNLGSDARTVTIGQSQALQFSIGSTRTRKDKDNQRVTDWVDVLYFKTGALPFLTKGRTVVVTGELEVRPYSTQAGEMRVGLKVVANAIDFVGGHDQQQTQQAAQPQMQVPPKTNDGVLPF